MPLCFDYIDLTAKITAGSLAVRLMYGVGGSPGYVGEAWVKYDAGRQAHVYGLPPMTRAKVGSLIHPLGCRTNLPFDPIP